MVSALSVAQLTNQCFIIALSAHDLHRGYCRSMFEAEHCSIVLADSFGKNRRGVVTSLQEMYFHTLTRREGMCCGRPSLYEILLAETFGKNRGGFW